MIRHTHIHTHRIEVKHVMSREHLWTHAVWVCPSPQLMTAMMWSEVFDGDRVANRNTAAEVHSWNSESEENKPSCKFQMIKTQPSSLAVCYSPRLFHFIFLFPCTLCWGMADVYVAVVKVQKRGRFFFSVSPLSKSTNSTFLQPVQRVCPDSGER